MSLLHLATAHSDLAFIDNLIGGGPSDSWEGLRTENLPTTPT